MNKIKLTAVLILGLWVYALPAFAGELAYTPTNPNFGGNPFNAAPLLNSAQAQNGFKDPSTVRRSTGNSLEERIDRLVLSTLARGLLVGITSSTTGNLVPGIIDTGLSTIEVIDDGTVLTIIVTDNATGESTTFTSPSP